MIFRKTNVEFTDVKTLVFSCLFNVIARINTE